MVKVRCRTNLDIHQCETWPEELPFRPNPGDFIESSTRWSGDKRLRLEVCGVTFRYSKSNLCWYAEVELHIPKHFNMSISKFEEWYRDLRR